MVLSDLHFQLWFSQYKRSKPICLIADKPLIIKTVAGGDVYIGADMILDGGDAASDSGYEETCSTLGEVEARKN